MKRSTAAQRACGHATGWTSRSWVRATQRRQAALFFSNHARSVTILCRGDTLEKSMSRYLIDQLATRASITVMFGAEIAAVHGDASLQAIEVRDAATGETTRLDSGGLFVFIGADADTAWLPPEIAVDHNGYVLTGPDVPARAPGTRPRPLSPGDKRSGHLRLWRCPIQSREARRRRRRRGQHGHRVRPPVPQGRRLGVSRGSRPGRHSRARASS